MCIANSTNGDYMRLLTFIKAYKIALYSISEKVSKWKEVYLGDVYFPGEHDIPDTRIDFLFSNSQTMEPGAIGLSVALDILGVENISGNIESLTLSSDSIKPEIKINDAGRVIVILDGLATQLESILDIGIDSVHISSMSFNFEEGLAILKLSAFKDEIYTDGNLILFGK